MTGYRQLTNAQIADLLAAMAAGSRVWLGVIAEAAVRLAASAS